jgi:beta-1,2-mannobiose phosphorylase / 1,2-beta-oligomannan phosphorylase
MNTNVDKIIFSPKDVDLRYSPIRNQLNKETYVLGAFNPGMTRLHNGNLLIMIRIAEALVNPTTNNKYCAIRWSKNKGYILDEISLSDIDTSDPRKYIINQYTNKTYCLTSFSWLLPVELSTSGESIIAIHYDKIIQPEEEYQEFGIEDARITKIDNTYYMTACAVSSTRHSTILYSSNDGVNYELRGVILDHQNKDMVLFPKMINGLFYALTRPTGDHYFASNMSTGNLPGPSINMAQSPDLLHWKPVDNFTIQAKTNSLISYKIGGGAPPIETDDGWLILFHGVEYNGVVGVYRTFVCLLDKKTPSKILSINYGQPVLDSNPSLTDNMGLKKYVEDVVFTSGIDSIEDYFILASGELDLCCRITHLNKTKLFGNLNK